MPILSAFNTVVVKRTGFQFSGLGSWFPHKPVFDLPLQREWTWGPDGQGAVLLVNCDRDDPKSTDMDNMDLYVRSYAGTGWERIAAFGLSTNQMMRYV